MVYDLIVSGGGPAGSTLARLMAREGFSVLLLEKETFPRVKLCAGGLTQRITELFDFSLEEVIEDTVFSIAFSFLGQHNVVAANDEPLVLMTRREKFDSLLLKKAEEMGAVTRFGNAIEKLETSSAGVRVTAGGKVYQGKLVIGADGVNSFTAQALDLQKPKPTGIGLSCQISVPEELEVFRGVMHLDFGVVECGYGWVFPKADHLSVGLYSFVSPQKNLKRKLCDYLAWKFPQGVGQFTIKGHPIPLGRRRGPIVCEHGLLLGDAAGLADPYTGEGIYYAVKSAHLAYRVLRDHFKEKSPLSAYEKTVDQEIIKELRAAQIIANVFHFAPAFNYRYFFQKREILRNYAQLLAGRISYQELLKHLVFFGPKYLVPPFLYKRIWIS